MWIKLQEILVNLDLVVEIRKGYIAPYESPGQPFTIQFLYRDGYGYRTFPFQLKEERDEAWDALLFNCDIYMGTDIDDRIKYLNKPTS